MPDATDGIDQPLYVPQTGLFYSSVPDWKEDNKQGGVAVIDPKTMKMPRLVHHIPGCQPRPDAGSGHQHAGRLRGRAGRHQDGSRPP